MTSRIAKKPLFALLRFVSICLSILGLASPAVSIAQTDTTTPTTIAISDTAKLTGAKHLGLVLGSQDYYDSGIFMRNLSFRNPGFEGEHWQTILHCEYVTATSCTDDNTYTYWPANFLKNASAEFIGGSITGTTTTVTSSVVAVPGTIGTVVNFSSAVNPAVGDYLVVKMEVPGNAQAGWFVSGSSGVVYSTELTDLSPNTPGKQALRMTMGGTDQGSVSTYIDTKAGLSFVQLNGNVTLNFRAKSTGGSKALNVHFGRIGTSSGVNSNLYTSTINLTTNWQDYTYTFSAVDGGQIGTLELQFTLAGGSMLLDDVAVTQAAASDNPTVYRNEVVSTLKALKPGILRFMDSGTNWGSTFDNMIAPDFARERSGYNNGSSEVDDIPLDLHDYLVLCQTIGAEPWYTMQTGMSLQEVSNMMDYLGGDASTVYGAKRIALGQTTPWTSVFSKIHLEFGNEVWNTSNTGATMTDPTGYGKRAGLVFTTIKASPSYDAKTFDLVLDGWEAVTYWTTQVLAASSNYDTVDVAPYLFGNFNDASSAENIYGPMFAEPEAQDSTSTGIMAQNAVMAASAARPARLSIYETNLGTVSGSVSQTAVNAAIPSAAAGITVADNMLLMLRDLGITDQNMFALPGYSVNFDGQNGSTASKSPLWGTVIDMGGLTNLQRPMFLSEQLANSAILPTMWNTAQLGSNPTWNQAYTTNDNFSLNGAHYIQSFVFTDGTTENVILFNLSRTSSLPVNFSGLNAPMGAATISTLGAPAIDSNNETQQNVKITKTTQTLSSGSTLSLPPYSMTVVSVAAPVVPVLVSSVTVTCPQSSISPSQSLACSVAVVGQGKYNSATTWSVDQGTISSTGVYTAPATLPASGTATIVATSVGDATQSGKFVLKLAPDAITGVTTTCNAATIGQGQAMNCSAAVQGTGGYSTGVVWKTNAGTIDANGNLTAPATGTSVTITATSAQDSSKSGSITVPVFPVLLISNPKSTVTSTTATVSWTLNVAAFSGMSYGTTQSLGNTTPYNSALLTNPSVTITGLQPATTYYFALFSYVNGENVSASYSLTTSGSGSTVTSVAVSCAATVATGATTTCSAPVQGTGNFSTAVNWTTSAGTITSSGVLTAPTTGSSVTVKATSVQDATKSASATISVTQTSTITGVTVSCGTTSVTAGGTTACSAPVTGTGSYSTAVTWSASAGTITSSGVLTAPTTGSSVTVTATSTQDKTKSGSATVAVTANATITSLSVTCLSASLAPSGTTTCAAQAQGTGSYSSAVTWSASAGTITSGGVLTAPATGSSVTVTATSTQDPTKMASATVSIAAASTIAHVLVACQAASVLLNATTTCAASVTGTGNYSSAVFWSVTGGGTIDQNGVFTASAAAGSSKIRATSVQDASNSGVGFVQVSADVAIVSSSVSVTATTATVNWTTTIAAHNGLSYGLTPNLNAGTTPYDANLLTNPSITLTGLQPSTLYYVSVFSFVNGATATKSLTFTTAAAATNTVSAVAVSCGASTLSLLGTTPCTATVSGKGNYSSAVTWTASAGSVTTAGLLTAPATGTSLTVKATSVQDPTKSASQTIALSTNLQILNSSFIATSTTIVVSWTDNQNSNNGVSYGTSKSYGSTTPYDPNSITNAKYTLTGLKPNTTYDLFLFSYNKTGSTGKAITVTTAAQ